jgi:indolepyruvate ferredoxin oxidoreductase alpha subunit
MDVAYNKGNSIAVILDNRITAMTGQQQNPGTGFTLMGEPTIEVDIQGICKALGFRDDQIREINPLNLSEVNDALDSALSKDDASVIITKWPCALKKYSEDDMSCFDLSLKICRIDQDKCKKCKMCVKTGCPAIHSGESIVIDENMCNGCTVCKQVCPFDSIMEVTK